jgi:hypothetical protein
MPRIIDRISERLALDHALPAAEQTEVKALIESTRAAIVAPAA